MVIFLGGGHMPFMDTANESWASWLSSFWFLAKIFGLIAVMIWLRGTLPRLRVDQLMSFAWKFLLPLSLLNIFVAGASLHLLGGGDLAGIMARGENVFLEAYRFHPSLAVAAWVIAGTILYCVAVGLDNLTRAQVRPRPRLYFE